MVVHDWVLSPAEVIALQKELSRQVVCKDRITEVKWVAGVDVGFENKGAVTRAAVAMLRFPELELVDYAIARLPTIMPYIPGLLSFRECPAILEALGKLSSRLDLLLCDGQGIAHLRGLGVANHLVLHPAANKRFVMLESIRQSMIREQVLCR